MAQANSGRLSVDNSRQKTNYGKKIHPNKMIEAALAELEGLGWLVETSKGRNAHAWGYVLCPENAKDKCRGGVFCRNQVWSTPRNPTGHARDLLRKAHGCIIRKDTDDE